MSIAMMVSGVGGAPSLPMTLPGSALQPTTTTAVPGTRSTSGAGEVQPSDQQRSPEQRRTEPPEPTGPAREKAPKPAPLPPLKGLTVAEIRAMLGVGPLPGQAEDTAEATSAATAATATTIGDPTSVAAAFLDRYV